ncbi:MAG: DUF4157 domain-containing protein [Anaerolineales bacterium]|nr:DUF4157 domain-containing protein [Chloroflexota bacterium]MBL6980106.1 DUF4157 domain-containing protein [Anaerolineales bacterium]
MSRIPKKLPPCAIHMLARPNWFADPGVVSRARLAVAGWLPRFLSSHRFAGTEIAAITLGHTIYFRKLELYNPHTLKGLALLAHELKHVEQFEREGARQFYSNYFSEYRKHGYSEEITLEAEAYVFERRIFAHLLKEFKHNAGRPLCWDQTGPHTPNVEFVQTPINVANA